jgi:hypothetical protein
VVSLSSASTGILIYRCTLNGFCCPECESTNFPLPAVGGGPLFEGATSGDIPPFEEPLLQERLPVFGDDPVKLSLLGLSAFVLWRWVAHPLAISELG